MNKPNNQPNLHPAVRRMPALPKKNPTFAETQDLTEIRLKPIQGKVPKTRSEKLIMPSSSSETTESSETETSSSQDSESSEEVKPKKKSTKNQSQSAPAPSTPVSRRLTHEDEANIVYWYSIAGTFSRTAVVASQNGITVSPSTVSRIVKAHKPPTKEKKVKPAKSDKSSSKDGKDKKPKKATSKNL